MKNLHIHIAFAAAVLAVVGLFALTFGGVASACERTRTFYTTDSGAPMPRAPHGLPYQDNVDAEADSGLCTVKALGTGVWAYTCPA